MTRAERREHQLKRFAELASERDRWLMEQQSYNKELDRKAREEFDANLMSNSKWEKVIEGLRDLPLWYRIKFIDTDEILDMSPVWIEAHGWVEGGGTLSPVPLIALEWLEIIPPTRPSRKGNPAHDPIACQDAVRHQLERINVAFLEESGVFRVLGHIKHPTQSLESG